MVAPRLEIFDETLRDGEQQAGVFFSTQDKRELAGLIGACGVDQIDVMPAVDAEEEALARELVAGVLGPRITCATPLGTSFVDQAVACGARRIILFYAVSDRLIGLRDHRKGSVQERRESVLARAEEVVQYARDRGLRVDFAAEDASRADAAFLATFARRLGTRLECLYVCDTVGILEPGQVGPWIRGIRQHTESRVGVHFHNDLGYAVSNTVEAVLAGAGSISGTFGGIGERAGNAAVEQVLGCLRLRHGIELENIRYDAIDRVLEFLEGRRIRSAPPFSRAARRHVSGMHVQALLQDPQSYEIFDNAEPEIWFGKLGGASNVAYLYERVLGLPMQRSEYQRISALIKERSRRERRCFPLDEVRQWVEAGEFEQPGESFLAGFDLRSAESR